MGRRAVLLQRRAVGLEAEHVPVAEALRARHERDSGLHAGLDLGLDGIAHHMFGEQQRTIGRKVHVRPRARAELRTSLDSSIGMNVEHDERMAVECPQRAPCIELQTTDKVRRRFEMQLAFRLQVRVELQNSTTPGVIVSRVVE
ncbi:MAG: hypothetical protein ACKO9D_00360, partial [Gammaproteobacteria bacterium]